MAIKPLGDRVVLQPIEEEAVTASGIVLPDTAKEKPQQGEVIAVGPGRRDDSGNNVAVEVTAGDKVIYRKYGGTEIKEGVSDYLIVSEDDILAVVD